MTHNKFLDSLSGVLDNRALTGNGAETYASTLNANLDLFYLAGGVRGNGYYGPSPDFKDLFKKAFEEDRETALRNLFNIRDFRGTGKGERQLFRDLLVTLAGLDEEIVIPLVGLGYVEKFGRYDDLVHLYKDTPELPNLRKAISNHLLYKLVVDKDALVAKWLPTNTRNKTLYPIAISIAKDWGLDFRTYRKQISAIRKQLLNLVETNLTNKDYSKIDYGKLPSLAFKKYTNAFLKSDEARYEEFITAVNQGEKSIHTGALTPDQLVHDITNGMKIFYYGPFEILDTQQDKVDTTNTIWKQMIKDATINAGDSLVVADVSASMEGKPMEVSLGLAAYFAQTNKGAFRNKFMQFSGDNKLVSLEEGDDLSQVIKTIMENGNDWGNTDIDKVFGNILKAATSQDLDQSELPERIIIISDMQFDEGTVDEPNFVTWTEKFKDAGYVLPTIVYWNVSSYSNTPARKDDKNVALISGFTPSTLTAVLEDGDVTPLGVMKRALFDPYYDLV